LVIGHQGGLLLPFFQTVELRELHDICQEDLRVIRDFCQVNSGPPGTAEGARCGCAQDDTAGVTSGT
jgi:hypothetical protein